MTRSRIGATTVAIATLVVVSLAMVAPAQALPQKGRTPHKTHLQAAPVRGTGGRPDPTFGPAKRRAEMTLQQRRSDDTAGRLGLGPKEGLVVKDVMRDLDGTVHVRYDRTYAGLPVVGGDLVVAQAPTGSLRATRATNARIAVGTTVARVSPAHADTLAASRNPGKAAGHAPVKVVYAANHPPVLAWQTTVTGTKPDGTPIRDLVYTDATTGRQIARLPQVEDAFGKGHSLYSGTVTLATVKSGSRYQLVDSLRGGHKTYDKQHKCCTSRGVLFTDRDDTWGNGKTTSNQTVAVDAAYGAATTWNFYKSAFGRNGIAGNGKGAYSRVHFRKGYDNAFWDDNCFCMTYGDGNRTFRPLVELDVAGHEMSHGLTAATAGLDYVGESGGLNESTSDVMGTMVEFSAHNAKDPGDYVIGEKLIKGGGVLRRMDNPKADGHSANCWSGNVGNRDVHYSSGVGNHAFYLLAEGTGTKRIGGRTHSSTTCAGNSLTGIGRNTAAQIWYRALTTYWTSTTNYHRAASGMIRAARDLYGDGSPECQATVNAWKGVAVTSVETCAAPPSDTGNLLGNPGFEQGDTVWSHTPDVIQANKTYARTGSGVAFLDGYGEAHTDTLTQSVTIPAAAQATLSFYLDVQTDEENDGIDYDHLGLWADGGDGFTEIAGWSNRDARDGYVRHTVDLSDYAGKTVTLTFEGVEDGGNATAFFLDDLALTTG